MQIGDGGMTAFLLYAAVFRVSVIAAGITCVVLGYRLFTHGLAAGSGPRNQSEIAATLGDAALTLRNVAPGTAFATFGAALIIAMMVQGIPRLDQSRTSGAGDMRSDDRLVLRGDDPLALAERGRAAESAKDIDGAVVAYQQALTALSAPMNNLAWLFNQRGESEKALALARVAVQLQPDNAAYLDTLATILLHGGQRQEALKVMREAARLDARYQAKVKQLEGS